MKILAIDTSTSVMGVALLDENKVYAEVITNLKKNHSIRLMPIIDQLFHEVNWLPNDIDLIAVAKGPGSYTGVRIGVTTAKTFAWALHIPLVGVSTLEALAYEHYHFMGYISPIIDARRGQVYTGLYQSNDNRWENVGQDRIILLSDWVDVVREKKDKVLFIGDDVTLHREKIEQAMGEAAVFSYPAFQFPRPSIIGMLGEKRMESGKIDNTFDFTPAYLQLAEAEVKWLEKQKG